MLRDSFHFSEKTQQIESNFLVENSQSRKYYTN